MCKGRSGDLKRKRLITYCKLQKLYLLFSHTCFQSTFDQTMENNLFILCLTEKNRNKHLILLTRHALIQKRRNLHFENALGCLPVDRPRGWGHCLACSCKGWGHSETWDSAWWLWADCSGSSQTHPAPAASAGRSSLYLRRTSRAEWTHINHYKTLWIFCLVHYFATFEKRNGSFTCTNLTNTKGDHFVRFSDILGHKNRKMMITEDYIKLIIWWKLV